MLSFFSFGRSASNSNGVGSEQNSEVEDERLKGIDPKMVELISNEVAFLVVLLICVPSFINVYIFLFFVR